MEETKEFIGAMRLGYKVDITDPCYDKGSIGRVTLDCEPGQYNGYAFVVDAGDWGNRVSSLMIVREDVDSLNEDVDLICDGDSIAVDSGLAGFFNDKKDFADDEWYKFCDDLAMGDTPKMYWTFEGDKGIFSDSGYGDGMYTVWHNRENTAFMISFISNYGD